MGPLVTFRFGFPDSTREDFLARTDDETVIAEARRQLALAPTDRHGHITGLIQRVPRGQNLNWSWKHRDSEWTFAEISMEVCDARPAYVEEHLNEWLESPGRFCPWACRVKAEEAGP